MYRFVGVLYLVSGLWCAFMPELAAGFLGFDLNKPTGLVEFVSVYGGLQVGIALAVLLTSFTKVHRSSGILYTLSLSLSLVLFRFMAIFLYGSSQALIGMLVLECILVVLLFLALRKDHRQSRSA